MHVSDVCRRAVRLSLFLSLSLPLPLPLSASLSLSLSTRSLSFNSRGRRVPLSPEFLFSTSLLPFLLLSLLSVLYMNIYVSVKSRLSHVLPWTSTDERMRCKRVNGSERVLEEPRRELTFRVRVDFGKRVSVYRYIAQGGRAADNR